MRPESLRLAPRTFPQFDLGLAQPCNAIGVVGVR